MNGGRGVFDSEVSVRVHMSIGTSLIGESMNLINFEGERGICWSAGVSSGLHEDCRCHGYKYDFQVRGDNFIRFESLGSFIVESVQSTYSAPLYFFIFHICHSVPFSCSIFSFPLCFDLCKIHLQSHTP